MMLVSGIFRPVQSQAVTNYERDSGREMLRMIKADIQKNYYDSTFHGVDLEARFKEADEKIKKATSNGHIFGIIAQTLIDFNDSHLYFLPPPRASTVEYGWQWQMNGDKCYVMAVKPGSDAEAKGLRPGDIILSMDGFEPTRENLWKMHYFYYTLRPKPGIRVVAQSPDGQPRQLDLMAKIHPGKKVVDFTQGNAQDWVFYQLEAQSEARLHRHRFYEQDDVVIWKMPGFDIYDQDKVDEKMAQARKGKALILDLRGNGGGYVTMLRRMLGYFFDRDVKIADVKYRKEVKQEVAKTRGGNVFKGKLVVLIDGESGSAAEIFARVIQLEKRGTVIGDRSAGAVMQSLVYSHDVGLEIVTTYGASVTDADVILTDGKSLEVIGVTPDELVLPTGADIAAQRDPVLARAAALVGLKLDPEKAGALFPIEWRK
jgi:C-terminal processing protease CtpA/Prc